MSKGFKVWSIILAIIGALVVSISIPMLSDSETMPAGIFGIVLGMGIGAPMLTVWIVRASGKKKPSVSESVSANPSVSAPDLYRFSGNGEKLSEPPRNYACIDVETTGLYPDSDFITEICAVIVKEGDIVDVFSSLIYTDKRIPKEVSDLTGITNDMLADAPTEDQVLPHVISFIGNLPIVGHNVSFDLRFINAAIQRQKMQLPNDYFDLLPYARKKMDKMAHYRLSDVASVLGIEQSSAHRAEADVRTTVACVEALRGKSVDAPRSTPRDAGYDYSGQHVDYAALQPTVAAIDPGNPLYGKRVVFTGILHRCSRPDAAQSVVNLGGLPSDNVLKRTDYLVIGDDGFPPGTNDAGSFKIRKAEEWKVKGSKIRILTESEFFGMIDGYESQAQ